MGAKADQKADESINGVAAYDAQVAPAAGAKPAPAFPSANSSGLDALHPFMARITCVRELHGKGSDRSCVHVEVDITGSKITYKHGDHIAVHAQNSPVRIRHGDVGSWCTSTVYCHLNCPGCGSVIPIKAVDWISTFIDSATECVPLCRITACSFPCLCLHCNYQLVSQVSSVQYRQW